MEHILGNEELKEHFKTAIRHKKISHAYILEGERGSGKKMIARAFAKLLQCENPMDTEEGSRACGRCNSCIMVEHRDHPDVIWIRHEKPGVISVGEVREQMVNTVDVMPYKGPYKIYIVDEAEKMNQAAQNAVLKTIEEPPGYAVIILLTTNRGAFLQTIRSRCILLNMKPAPDELVKNYLMRECQVTGETAEFCTGFAMGNIGKAKEAAVSEDFAKLKECGLSILRYLHELEDYELISRIKALKEWKDTIEDYLDIMLIWFRDILVLKAMADDSKLIFKSEYSCLDRQSKLLIFEDINAIINQIGQTRMRIKANVNFDTSMEILHIGIKNRYQNR